MDMEPLHIEVIVNVMNSPDARDKSSLFIGKVCDLIKDMYPELEAINGVSPVTVTFPYEMKK